MSSLPQNLHNFTKIRINQRFATYKAENEKGEPVFVKQIAHPELGDSLRKETYGLIRISELSKIHDFPFVVPQIIQNGEDYLVTTWAKGETMKFDSSLDDLDKRADFFAKSYGAIDFATELIHPGIARFAIPGKHNQTTIQRLETSLKQVPYSDFFDTQLITQSFDYLNKHVPNLTARFTHADFTPNNIIESPNERTLIDWESASELWPRFYDIVNFTHNRMFKHPNLAPTFKAIIEQFFSEIQSTPAEHLQQLNTIAAVRAVSSISDFMTEPNDYHNTKDSMTPKIATQITTTLERVLAGKLYL